MLGVKLEDRQALDRAAETLSVPGLAFAEHGPRDLGLSYGYLEGRADPPLPPEVVAAGDMVLELTKERGMFFLDNVLPGNVAGQIDRGVMIGAGRREDSAEVGREYSERRMPWWWWPVAPKREAVAETGVLPSRRWTDPSRRPGARRTTSLECPLHASRFNGATAHAFEPSRGPISAFGPCSPEAGRTVFASLPSPRGQRLGTSTSETQ